MSDKPWYRNGLRFECQRCGRCCTNRDGYSYVYLTEADLARLLALVELPRKVFLERYCETHEGRITLHKDNAQCVFLKEGGSCSVYAARPHQCRSWPFWRENLERKVWEGEIETLCPGVGKGPLHTAKEIEAIASKDEEWYDF